MIPKSYGIKRTRQKQTENVNSTRSGFKIRFLTVNENVIGDIKNETRSVKSGNLRIQTCQTKCNRLYVELRFCRWLLKIVLGNFFKFYNFKSLTGTLNITAVVSRIS